MKTRSHLQLAGGALAALVVAVGLGACTPGTDITASESDIAATQFDPEVDFGAIDTIAMADSILHLTQDGSDDPNLSRANDAAILNQFQANFEALGYTVVRVDSIVEGQEPAELLIIGATSTDFIFTSWGCGGYWGYWWYYPPGYGCYGPPSAGVAYSTGTLVASLIDPDRVADLEAIPTDWLGAINGVLSGGSIQARLEQNIDQLFVQSPYLGRTQ